MSDDVINSVKTMRDIGREKYLNFQSQRILPQEKYWTDKITKTSLPLMAYNIKPSKKNTDMSILKQERSHFVQMLLSVQANRDIDEDVFASDSTGFSPFGLRSLREKKLTMEIRRITYMP